MCVTASLSWFLCINVRAHYSFLFFFLLRLFTQEGGRSKSHRYWPKLGSKHNSATHGKFKVTTKFRTDSGNYATTGLKVKHLLSGQERTVWHLQYTDWPEQGCPEYVQGFLCECHHRHHQCLRYKTQCYRHYLCLIKLNSCRKIPHVLGQRL